MLEKLNETQKKAVETVRQNAINQGYRAYIVGGVVRDLILDKKIKDIDFLIEGSAIEFSQKSGFKIISKHPEFDTVKVEIEGINYDIASTRTEYYKKNGALPSVEFVGVEIEKDLKRRDFTINAIAINIINNEIIDPYLGQKDIKDGILRVLHNKSFMDDPTRILRGLDFKYRFNFEFGDFEKNLIKECKDNFNNEGLSIDRIYLTLNKIFKSEMADKILFEILENKIYKIWMKKTDIKLEDIERLEDAIKKFKIKEKNKIYIMALDSFFYIKAPLKDDFEIYEFFKKFNEVQLAFYYFKTKDENALKYLELKDIKTYIKGCDLIEEGFIEGEIIGKILKSVLKEKILNKGSLASREKEMEFVKNNFKL